MAKQLTAKSAQIAPTSFLPPFKRRNKSPTFVQRLIECHKKESFVWPFKLFFFLAFRRDFFQEFRVSFFVWQIAFNPLLAEGRNYGKRLKEDDEALHMLSAISRVFKFFVGFFSSKKK